MFSVHGSSEMGLRRKSHRKGLRPLRQPRFRAGLTLFLIHLLLEALVTTYFWVPTKILPVCVLICVQEADERRKLRAKLGRSADLWRAGEVELESSLSLADPNLKSPCLKVEGDLFVDLSGGVERREYLCFGIG
jgi:hypothetical protein